MAGGRTIKVLLAEREEVFRRGLVNVLQETPNVEIVAICTQGSETIEKSIELNPDIILLDEGMIEVSHSIRERLPEKRIILITTPSKESDIRQILKAEANAYIDKDITITAITGVLSRVYQGDASVSPRIARKLLKEAVPFHEVMEGEHPKADINLSRREAEVLILVAKGERNKEIASRLCISENTVKGHLSSILAKMHVRNRLQAVSLAREKGIVLGIDKEEG